MHHHRFVWLTPPVGYNITEPVDIHSNIHFPPTGDGPHALTQTGIKIIYKPPLHMRMTLPFESFAVSPPLYSWGAPTKMPPTFCHEK